MPNHLIPFLPQLQFLFTDFCVTVLNVCHLKALPTTASQSTFRPQNYLSACASYFPLYLSHRRFARSCVFVAPYLASDSFSALVEPVL